MNMNKGLLVVLVLAAVVAVTAALCEEGEEVTYSGANGTCDSTYNNASTWRNFSLSGGCNSTSYWLNKSIKYCGRTPTDIIYISC